MSYKWSVEIIKLSRFKKKNKFKGYHGKENYLPSYTNKLLVDRLKHED